MKYNLPGLAERTAPGDKLPPLSRNTEVDDVEKSVDDEKPRQGKVDSHSFGEAMMHIESLIDPLRKKWPVDVVRPVNQNSAPDHDKEERKVDPVIPANPKRMFCPDLQLLPHAGDLTQS